jgi:hypothetical protein
MNIMAMNRTNDGSLAVHRIGRPQAGILYTICFDTTRLTDIASYEVLFPIQARHGVSVLKDGKRVLPGTKHYKLARLLVEAFTAGEALGLATHVIAPSRKKAA